MFVHLENLDTKKLTLKAWAPRSQIVSFLLVEHTQLRAQVSVYTHLQRPSSLQLLVAHQLWRQRMTWDLYVSAYFRCNWDVNMSSYPPQSGLPSDCNDVHSLLWQPGLFDLNLQAKSCSSCIGDFSFKRVPHGFNIRKFRQVSKKVFNLKCAPLFDRRSIKTAEI